MHGCQLDDVVLWIYYTFPLSHGNQTGMEFNFHSSFAKWANFNSSVLHMHACYIVHAEKENDSTIAIYT
jgi:hypothetical protein